MINEQKEELRKVIYGLRSNDPHPVKFEFVDDIVELISNSARSDSYASPASQGIQNGGSLLTTLKINEEPIQCTPIEALKILVAALPDKKYDGSDRDKHWTIIENWLDELLQKASQREA